MVIRHVFWFCHEEQVQCNTCKLIISNTKVPGTETNQTEWCSKVEATEDKVTTHSDVTEIITNKENKQTKPFRNMLCDRQCKRGIFVWRRHIKIIFAIHSNFNQELTTTPYKTQTCINLSNGNTQPLKSHQMTKWNNNTCGAVIRTEECLRNICIWYTNVQVKLVTQKGKVLIWLR